MHVFPQDILSAFELDKVLQLAAQLCQGKRSEERMLSILPQPDARDVMPGLLQVNEFLGMLLTNVAFPSLQFHDLSRPLTLLKVSQSVLEEKDLLNIAEVSDTVNRILEFFADKKLKYPALQELMWDVYKTDRLTKAIFQVLDQKGVVKTSASRELARIRKELLAQRRQTDRLFLREVQKMSNQGILADYRESFLNGRRVLAVLAEHKRGVGGIIHGSSSTGKVTYIEPGSTVGLNNEVAELLQEERREIRRILKELTTKIRPDRELIAAYEELLINLDMVRAKARLANKMDACLPRVVEKACVHLEKAYHPLLLLQNRELKKPTIPLSVSLDEATRIMVISGPNAGGKSVTLKTIGLLQVMLQCGFLIPVDSGSELGFFEAFFADIGDSQSIEYELSTYSSRLLKMKTFLAEAGHNNLVLIDEFGTGSDPELGAAIAEVILEELTASGALGVVTTHYGGIKLLAEELEGAMNGSMLFDQNTLLPLYELQVGEPGSSYTFEVAEKIGLPRKLIKRARRKISKDKLELDQLLVQLRGEKQALTQQLDESRQEQRTAEGAKEAYEELATRLDHRMKTFNEQKRERERLAELGKKLEGLIGQYAKNRKRKDIMGEVVKVLDAELLKRQKQQEADQARKKTQNLRKKVQQKKQKKKREAQQAIDIAEHLKVGSRVKIKGSRQIGEVEEIKKDKISVQFGMVRTIVTIDKLYLVDPPNGRNKA